MESPKYTSYICLAFSSCFRNEKEKNVLDLFLKMLGMCAGKVEKLKSILVSMIKNDWTPGKRMDHSKGRQFQIRKCDAWDLNFLNTNASFIIEYFQELIKWSASYFIFKSNSDHNSSKSPILFIWIFFSNIYYLSISQILVDILVNERTNKWTLLNSILNLKLHWY